jgi:hypothetical protein
MRRKRPGGDPLQVDRVLDALCGKLTTLHGAEKSIEKHQSKLIAERREENTKCSVMGGTIQLSLTGLKQTASVAHPTP